MAKKQLKVSMIFGGAYHTFGTVLEEDEIPPSLRKAKYLIEPEPEPDLEPELFGEDEDLIVEEEEFKPPPSLKRKLR